MNGGAVASGHKLTSEASIEILKSGGNAFDAAIAGLWMSCVTEPVLVSPGGGGYLLSHTPTQRVRNQIYDFFTVTPLQRFHDRSSMVPIQADFGNTVQEFHIGGGSIATPGMIAGLFHIHERLGSMPMDRLLEPAIEAARTGVVLNKFQSHVLDVVSPIFLYSESSRKLFASSDGKTVKQPGSTYRLSSLADFFETLGREGARFFYQGDGANDFLNLCTIEEGHLSRDDLTSYKVLEREPLSVSYGGNNILLNPAPTVGGSLIASLLSLMESTSSNARRISEIEHVADFVAAQFSVNQMRRDLEAGKQSDFLRSFDSMTQDQLREAFFRTRKAYRGTSHISVVDAQGNAASATVSNGEGCGFVLPSAGFMPNNMLGEEDVNPEGIDRWPPGKRMASMMAPSMIEHDSGILTVLGTGGSNRIPGAIAQVIINLIDYEHDLEQAIRAPRIHRDHERLNVENLFNNKALNFSQLAENVLLWEERNLFFGGVHAVQRAQDGGLHATGDPRRLGHACVELV